MSTTYGKYMIKKPTYDMDTHINPVYFPRSALNECLGLLEDINVSIK